MTHQELTQYLDRIRQRCELPFFIERLFQTDEEWERVAAYEFRSVSLSSRTEITLPQVIARRAVVILGEPGSGKSTLTKAAVQHALELGLVPLLAELRSYSGDLPRLIEQTAGADFVRDRTVDGSAVERILILDGIDDVPQALIERFVDEFETTLESNAYRHVILTSRQAFYAANRRRFRNPPEAFYILGLSERNVRSFVKHHGGDFDLFMAEVLRVGLSSEVTNPFALEVLYQTFTETGALGSLHYEAVEHVVESLIASRPHVAADRQRRALRMLAVAMEAASRNELLTDEAIQLLQAAMPVSAHEAENLLDELTHSILIRTPDGVSFQMRSYGEFLAAVELRGMTLERIQLLVNYSHSGIPNDSWRNCVSYLAELHPGIRYSFALQHPDWMIAASPRAFTEDERTTVVTRLLDRLAVEKKYIRRHPFLHSEALARFVTPAVERQLMTDLASTDSVRAGNAFSVLGGCGVRGVTELALPIAVDQSHPQLLRESAIGAVAAAGDSSLIPTLIDALDSNDPLHLSLVDCIGALTDAAAIPRVLPLLLETDALVSSAFYRFRDLHSHEAVDEFLAFLAKNPTAVSSSRFGSYADPLWEAMADLWDPRWADTVADLVIAWERAQFTERDVEEATDAILRSASGDERVCRTVLARFLAAGEQPFYFSRAISRLVTLAAARWLVEQRDAEALIEVVARLGSPEVRRVLAPHVGGLVEQQDAAIAAVREADRAEEEREARRTAAQRNVITTSEALGPVLEVLSLLSAKDWPEVDNLRKTWMAQQCEDWLRQIDPLRSVRWQTENRFSHHPALPMLVRLIDYYGLRIPDDVLLIQSLMACESQPLATYHRRHGLSGHCQVEGKPPKFVHHMRAPDTTRSQYLGGRSAAFSST